MSGGAASLIAALTPTNFFNGGNFGYSVHLKNNTLFVGSPIVPGVSNAQGCVYIYDIPAQGAPILVKRLQPVAPMIGDGERFGSSVVWEGACILVGSSGNKVLAGNGGIYIYDANELVNPGAIPLRAASGNATVAGVFVVGVNLTDGGCGYTNTPMVRFVGGGGSGAQAVAVVSNGVVVAVNVMNAGYGYTSTPMVVIAPPFIPDPTLSIAPMTLLSFTNVAVGGGYQLQSYKGWYWTNELSGITAGSTVYTQMVAGAPGTKTCFAPTAATDTQFLYITNSTGLFRLRYLP